MEPPSKRRRLYAPRDNQPPPRFDDRHEYYEAQDELEEDEGGPTYDPDQDLQQKRARLDFKLKSTFESIFEKYEKDFDGVGDEIDLYTGEILVDNGHLRQMQSERDAGEPTRARGAPRTLTGDSDGLMSSSVEGDDLEDEEDEDYGEDGEDGEDYDNEDPLSDEDMVEDDMILRGFAQARQFMAGRPSLQQSTLDIGPMGHRKEPRRSGASHRSPHQTMIPSRSDILSQFGPQLGPEIAKYVSRQGGLEDTSIEPIWRAPPLILTTSERQPIIKPAVMQPEIERPPSPDNSPSIWAPKRTRFRAADDSLLVDFLKEARRIGQDLSGHLAWKELEETHPQHDWKSWKTRYEKKFSYIYSGPVDESEISTSEVSADGHWISNQHESIEVSRLNFASSTARQPPRPATHDQPTSIRKQVPLDTEDELSLYNPSNQDEFQGVPCPHADCKAFPPTFRLERYEDEELSPLCLHLLRTHHITPFPCAEFNCDRKGDRGYFIQEDLVKHVKEAHPYTTALNRLRGRVDSGFFDQGCFKLTRPQPSTQALPSSPESQPQNSDFMLPRGHVDRATHMSSTHLPSSHSAQDITPTGRALAGLNQTDAAYAPSLHVNPSSGAISSPAREHSVEKLYDSDVQILDGDPFLPDTISLLEETTFPCPVKDSTSCDKVFTTPQTASAHLHAHNKTKAPCTYPRCQRIISTTKPGAMITQMKVHDKNDPNALSSSEQDATASKSHASLPVRISSSSNSPSGNAYNTASTPTQANNHIGMKKHIGDPLPRNTVDPSYEFSDEELELPRLVKEALTPVVKEAPPRPINELTPRIAKEQPRSVNAVAPRIAKEVSHGSAAEPVQPRPPKKPKSSLDNLARSPSIPGVEPQFVTPSSKAKPRKSIIQSVVAPGEFDELSLPGGDDLLFISSRPRSGFRPNLASQTRVKREETATPGGILQSSRKRRFSMLGHGEEIDELGTAGPATVAPARRVATSAEPYRVKNEDEQVVLIGTSSKGVAKLPTKREPKVRSSLAGPLHTATTPVRRPRPSSSTSTPLIDLVPDDELDDVTLPPRSAMDSSPTARRSRARLRGEVGGPRASVKQEGDHRPDWTPGGTPRRCGAGGIACGRAFCFTCPRG